MSEALQTLEQRHDLSCSVGAGAVGLLTHISRPGGGSYLGSNLKLGQRDLTGSNSRGLAEQRDDQCLLGGPGVNILGVDLADELLGAVGPVQRLDQGQDVGGLTYLGRPSLSLSVMDIYINKLQ